MNVYRITEQRPHKERGKEWIGIAESMLDMIALLANGCECIYTRTVPEFDIELSCNARVTEEFESQYSADTAKHETHFIIKRISDVQPGLY